jgi:hypothetical protein
MEKSYRIQCTIDVAGEYSALTAAETLTHLIMEDGDNWAVSNVKVLNVYELTEQEII